MNLKEQIKKYEPYNEVEKTIKGYMLKWLDTFDDVLTRENEFGHFASSAFVVNKDRTKMLVVYHNIYDAWIFPGDMQTESIISASPIAGHVKRGKYIPAHTHLDVVYLLEADDKEKLVFREDESKGVKWISFDEAIGEHIVDFIRPVHKRMIEKLQSNASY